MQTFQEFTNQDYFIMADDAILLSERSVEQLYEILGHAANDAGIQVSNNPNVLFDRINNNRPSDTPIHAVNYIADTAKFDSAKAESDGESFWNKFSRKIRNTICQNQQIIDLINGADLKDKLVAAIPVILAAIGASFFLAPVYLGIIAIALAIIIKSGFAAYCAA